MSKEIVYTTKSEIESMGIQRHLDSKGINYIVVDKQDSAYASIIGEIQFLVEQEDFDDAKAAIETYFED